MPTRLIEAEFIGANTQQPVTRVVRKVLGSTLQNASQKITAKHFQLAISQHSTCGEGIYPRSAAKQSQNLSTRFI